MQRRTRVPAVVATFFVADLTLGAAYILDYLADHPYGQLSLFLDLNKEGNLPTWYSSVQWFSVAILWGLFAQRNFRRSQAASCLLLILPLVFLALSLDEVAQIHEWLGVRSDSLLPGASRKNTMFSHTGIWMLVFGVPFVAGFTALALSLRSYFCRAPGAFRKILWGMAVMLAGALGIEMLSNFVVADSLYGTLQVFAEELSEMLGATMVLWGSYELLAAEGIVLGPGEAAAP